MKRNQKIIFAKMTAVMSVIPILLWAHSTGPDAGKAGVPGESNCTEIRCHVGTALNGGGGSVAVTFPGGATYTPGVKQHLSVKISDPTARMWGFQLTARTVSNAKTPAGTLASTDRFTAVVCAPANLDPLQQVFIDFPSNQNCATNKPLAYVEHTLNGSSRLQQDSQTYEFDWTPPSTDVGDVAIYVAGNAANGNGNETGDHIYTASYTLKPLLFSGTPAISTDGVVNGATFKPGIAPGAWFTVFGSNFAPAGFQDDWSRSIVNGKLPTSLDGVTVEVGGKPAYINLILPGQINAIAPDVGDGSQTVKVTTPSGTSTTVSTTAQQAGPAFFLWPGNQPVSTRNADGSYAVKAGTFAGLTTTAAKPGDVLILWGTGFGPTDNPVPPGIQTPTDKLYNTASKVTITINNTPADVIYAILAPTFAGLNQIAITVPASLADGDWPIKASVGSFQSPDGVLLSVKK
jgi:uncharacterized protein (TIGR03437 family)